MVRQEWVAWIIRIECFHTDKGPVFSQDLFLFSCSVPYSAHNNKQLGYDIGGHDQYTTVLKMGFKFIDR